MLNIIYDLLKTDEGQKLLESNNNIFGIEIKTLTWNNTIDYKNITLNNNNKNMNYNNVPLGYEEDEEYNYNNNNNNSKNIFKRKEYFNINIIKKEFLPDSFNLISCSFIPNCESDKFDFKLYASNGSEGVGTECLAGETTTFELEANILSDYQGYLNRWMILGFEGTQHHNILATTTSTCYISIRIAGNVLNETKDHILKSLNVDAAPFTPQIAKNYFDSECYVSYLDFNSIETYSAPPNFHSKISFLQNLNMVDTAEIDENLLYYYKNALDTNDFDSFITYYGIGNIPRFSSRGDSHTNKYLESLLHLNKIEDYHFNYSTCTYDKRYVPIKFYLHSHGMFGFELIVKGSNENRPKVLVGDYIRLRPSIEDCQVQLSYFLYDICHLSIDLRDIVLIFNMFEIQAIVSHYDLRTEKVTCQCCFPRPEELIYGIYKLQESNLIQLDNFAYTYIYHRILSAFFEPSLMFQLMSKLKYHIRFTTDSTGYDLIHRAICDVISSTSLKERIFPSHKYQITPQVIPSIQNTQLNRTQQEAVATVSMLCKNNSIYSLPPYIIYGPPGTGKTITLIEIIKKVYSENNKIRILACAPSDAAADVLCGRLAPFFTPDQLLRLNWWQRLVASVPVQIIKYCHLHTTNSFEFPPIDFLENVNIIVCTIVTAGFLRCMDEFHTFDLVLIDEVSQATEPETFVPITLCSLTGVVVLAGDPEQLGPLVRSPPYFVNGMSQSLQEKLLKNQLYHDIKPNIDESIDLSNNTSTDFRFSKLGVYLTLNYRSQKSILSLPSQLFYNNSLQEYGKRNVLDSLGSWELLNNAKINTNQLALDFLSSQVSPVSVSSNYNYDEERPFVVLFKGVNGCHKHEVDSPAFYNTEEISAIVEICHSLVYTHGKKLNISTKDIGVIGAFRSQVLKLRLALRESNLGNISVGSVEDFQGQETRIIIISTVLSHRILSLEVNGSLGLIGDHHKFNVALTRGMHLAIVVGHPYCLSTDNYWKQLMNYCDEHGTYTGFECTLLDRVQKEINEENELLNIITKKVLYENESQYQRQYNPDLLEWRGLL